METFQFGNDEVEITPALSVTHRLCYPHPNLISWLMVNNLLVASLRSQFSLVYLCVQFVFSAAALHDHFLVRWISRLIALWYKGVYIPSLHFVRTTLNLDQLFSSIGKWRPLFLNDHGILYVWNNCSGHDQWRRKSSRHSYNINGIVWLSFWWLTSFCGTYVSLRMCVV